MYKRMAITGLAGLLSLAATSAHAWWGGGWNPYDPWDPRYWMEEFFGGGGYYGGGPWGYGGGPWGYGGGPWSYSGPWGYGGGPWGNRYGYPYSGYSPWGYGVPYYGYGYAPATTWSSATTTEGN